MRAPDATIDAPSTAVTFNCPGCMRLVKVSAEERIAELEAELARLQDWQETLVASEPVAWLETFVARAMKHGPMCLTVEDWLQAREEIRALRAALEGPR